MMLDTSPNIENWDTISRYDKLLLMGHTVNCAEQLVNGSGECECMPWLEARNEQHCPA